MALALAIVVGILAILIVGLLVILWILRSGIVLREKEIARRRERWQEERREIIKAQAGRIDEIRQRHHDESLTWIAEKATIINEAREREARLVEELVKAAGRPPVVIDSSEAIRQIGETISRITQGPPEAVVESLKLKQDVAERWKEAMDANFGDPGAGIAFSPFGDVDGWMDPAAAAAANQDRSHVAVANGKLSGDRNLATGAPIEFRSGDSGTRPVGGIED